jgi:predicted nucleic acid-binding protein
VALTHLDAGVLIGFLDSEDAHHRAARAAVADALHGGERLAMASSALAECLVGPARHGDDAVAFVHDVRQRLPIEIIGIGVDIATTAARLRAGHRTLRLPDAFVIASAAAEGADRLVTTDRRWPSQSALGIETAIHTI